MRPYKEQIAKNTRQGIHINIQKRFHRGVIFYKWKRRKLLRNISDKYP